MAIELGKAYVQIMPSAKGISGSIQKVIAPEATAAGKSAGRNIATAIADSLSKAGSAMTKYITTPAMAAATAVSGLVSALGFKRLVGMDNAQAKLKGLGIEGKQLEIVMKNAKDAVTGTTHTMADGVNVAAGALAAGVKEGTELERYIKLVGDAATGANAPMGEMAQIFNRIQGTGKLMGTELEMIEYRLPGFSQALAKHLGVAPEEMRKMVSEGKVSVDDFLSVMEGYAGGMSAAYAETWSGLKDNVLANIGIIGEALLEGLFEDGKKGMAKFLDYLRNSEGLKEWARDTGETLRNVFSAIVEAIKTSINWWTNLSDGAKTAFLSLAGMAVAIGPALVALSKIITTGKAVTDGLKAIKGGFLAAKAGGVVASGAMSKLGGVIATLLGPVGLIIGAIAGLIAVFVLLYKKNEGFRDLVHTVWEAIKETITTVIQAVSDFVMNIFGFLVDWFNENNELIRETIQIVWEKIQEVVTKVLDVIVPIIQTAWDVIKIATETVWNIIKTAIETVINVIMGIIKTIMQIITGDWKGAWETIKDTVYTLLGGVKDIISNLLSGAFEIIKQILSNIKERFSAIFNSLKDVVSEAFGNVKKAVSDGISKAYDTVTGFFTKFKEAGNNIVTSIADGIKGATSKVTEAISNVTQKIRNFLPFSPPKEGPLIDIMDVKWGETISAGILKGENQIASAMERALDFDLTKTASFNVNSDSMSHRTTQQQSQPIVLQVDGKTFASIIGDYTSAEGGNRIRRIERGLAT
mgnify:CR=1 FL=1